jgi:ribosomal-protein-alanine N-acetyltransferase
MVINKDIICERLILKNLDESDVTEKYLSWMNDKEVLKYLEVKYSPPTSISDLKVFINNVNADDKNLFLGIFLKENLHHIGNVKLGSINTFHKRADIGFIIGNSQYWGMGLASEAIKGVSDYAFKNMDIKKLTAGCYENNIASMRTLVKSGFVQEATLASHVVFNDHRINVFLFGKVLD